MGAELTPRMVEPSTAVAPVAKVGGVAGAVTGVAG